MEVQRTNRTRILELETVRALHQTVVSLRVALEASKSELDDLRLKYQSHLDNSSNDIIKQLTQENRSLKNKLENNNPTEETKTEPEYKEEQSKKVTFNLEELDRQDTFCEIIEVQKGNTRNIVITEDFGSGIDDFDSKPEEIYDSKTLPSESLPGKDALNGDKREFHKEDDKSKYNPYLEEIIIKNFEENVISELVEGEFETKLELESKFDLTIKVSAGRVKDLNPIVVETNNVSDIRARLDGNENNDSNINLIASETVEVTCDRNDSQDLSLNMAGSREGGNTNRSGDKFNVQVKITSEENLLLEPFEDKENNSDHLNMEPDDVSIRSISEGDNSVFSETLGGGNRKERVGEQESMSGNESEEVDDIELIFTTDDTKELTGFQEDLVSITEGENWCGVRSDASTPVLVKFNVLDPETQANDKSNIDQHARDTRVNPKLEGINVDGDTCTVKSILRKDIANDHNNEDENKSRRPFLRSSSSKNYLDTVDSKRNYRKSFESNDSFSFDNQKSFSFDNTKSSSFERDSSVDAETRELSFDHRDESLDQFDILKTTLRTQYSVCLETDISKCGMIEDDGFAGSLNTRRNTCPNPFQYRPLPHREVVRGGTRPMLVPPGPRPPRRSSAAQTHISALPTQWRSDTHLSRKILPLALTTLPSKVHTEGSSLGPSTLAPGRTTKTTRRTEEARRVLLSDIGFTSMVPELSRSAEPIWAGLGPGGGPLCCVHHAGCLASVPSSPTSHQSPINLDHSRYWSKGSMHHSTSGKMGDQKKVSFFDQGMRWRGSLPELRPVTARCWQHRLKGDHRSGGGGMGDSEDSTDELLDEADRFITSSIGCLNTIRSTSQDEFCPSRYSRPYLPSGPRQLRLGHLVKVITPHGRIALGKVKYVGIAGGPWSGGGAAPTYVGLQVSGGASLGGSGGDGTFRGRRYFHCEHGKSLFVPFSKVVMAWADC